MNKLLKLVIIGGDLRQARVAGNFAECGLDVNVIGLDEIDFSNYNSIKVFDNIEDALKSRDVVILPIPYSNGDEKIKTPFGKKDINISDVLRNMDSSQILFAGKIDEHLNSLAKLYNIHLVDYLKREEMSVLNTVPTVEGALKIAISETPHTIHGSNCLVMGYGRIGKLLSANLKALGANVDVSARKLSDLAWIKVNVYNPVTYDLLYDTINKYDIIFNTVPFKILDYKMLQRISDSCLIIDLASKPGGVDFESASKLGKNVIWALSLPGKVASDTAGDIIKNTIINILEELGV